MSAQCSQSRDPCLLRCIRPAHPGRHKVPLRLAPMVTQPTASQPQVLHANRILSRLVSVNASCIAY
jgi:hypothetical protein